MPKHLKRVWLYGSSNYRCSVNTLVLVCCIVAFIDGILLWISYFAVYCGLRDFSAPKFILAILKFRTRNKLIDSVQNYAMGLLDK